MCFSFTSVRAMSVVLGCLFLMGSAGHCFSDTGESEILAAVNGELITTLDLDRELEVFLSKMDSDNRAPVPPSESILRRMIQNKLLEQEGYAIHADSLPNVRGQVRQLVRGRGVLVLLDSIASPAATAGTSAMDSSLSQESVMFRVSHILLDDEATARSLLESLSVGVPFGDLADRHTVDTIQTVKQGDLGWARQGAYIPEFEKAMIDLSVGEISEPVKTEFGWHLIQLTDRRVETAGQSEEMKSAMLKAVAQEKMKATVEAYVLSLKEKYGVVVNDSLLATLDFASADPAVHGRMKNSDAVLADSPEWQLTVRGLVRRIQFKHFHGLEGKPEASGIRDKMFKEYLDETLLAQEVIRLGIDKRPDIVSSSMVLERELVREKALEMIVDFPFDPQESEIQDYYDANSSRFTPKPEIKVQSAILATEEEAVQFRWKIDEGVSLKWLAERTEGVVEVDPGYLSGWVNAGMLGIPVQDAEPGRVFGPLDLAEGWTVLVVTAVGEKEPIPLADCRTRVIRNMRSRRGHEVLTDAIGRLESASEIEIQPNANDLISSRIRELESEMAAGQGDL